MQDHYSTSHSGDQPHIQRVQEAIDLGINTVPVQYKGKDVVKRVGWQNESFSAAVWKAEFNDKPWNIGGKLGPRNNGVVDIDLDDPILLSIASMFLPVTDAIYGHSPSKPRSHWLYRTECSEAIQVYNDPVTSKRLLEIRANGQSVLPGSVHESTGELIDWEGDPPRALSFVPLEDLKRACNFLAMVGLLAKYWPEAGTGRDQFEMAIAGGMLRSGFSEDETVDVIEAGWLGAGEQLDGSTRAMVQRTGEKLNLHQSVSGWPTVAVWLGDNGWTIVDEIHKWFSIEKTSYLYASDFWALSADHTYMYIPTNDVWIAKGVNSRLPKIQRFNADGSPKLDRQGNPVFAPATDWIDENQAVEQVTWWPGMPVVIRDKLVAGSELIVKPGAKAYNLYKPPAIGGGDPAKAEPWIEHGKALYPDEWDHMVKWFAQRVQMPHIKINHALVLTGYQGSGKDTLLKPVLHAVGTMNCQEAPPTAFFGNFNYYAKSVILRINEARDLGESGAINRYSLYERMKEIIAEPPEAFIINEKHKQPYKVPNVTGVIYTTNYKTGGMFLPVDDRRHFVAASDMRAADWPEKYFVQLNRWYEQERGFEHVAAYLASYDLTDFDPKERPPRTAAWREMVAAEVSADELELRALLDQLGNPSTTSEGDPEWPKVISLDMLRDAIARGDGVTLGGGTYGSGFGVSAFENLRDTLTNRKRLRYIPALLESIGYRKIENPYRQDNRWKVGDRPLDLYGYFHLDTPHKRVEAAKEFVAKNG